MREPQKETIRKTETYKVRRPLNSYDIVAVETWLEDQAQQGYHMLEFKGSHGVFEKGKPERWRYRMQLLAQKEAAPSPRWAGMCWRCATKALRICGHRMPILHRF